MFAISSINQLCVLEKNFNSSLPLKPTQGPLVYKCETISVLTPQGSYLCDFNLAKINNNLIVELVTENHLIRRIVFVSDSILRDPSTSPDDLSTYRTLSLIYDSWFEFRSPMALARNEEEKRINNAVATELRRKFEESQQKCQESERKCKETERKCKETEREYEETLRKCKETERKCKETERKCKESEQKFEQANRVLFDFHEKVIRLSTTVAVRNFAMVFFFSSWVLTPLKNAFSSTNLSHCWYNFQALPHAKLCSKTRCPSSHKNYFHPLPKSFPLVQFTKNPYSDKRFAFPHPVSQFFWNLPLNP